MQDEAQTWNNLSPIDCDIREFNYDGNWGNPGSGPLFRRRDFWNFKTCKHTDYLLSVVSYIKFDFYPNTSLGII